MVHFLGHYFDPGTFWSVVATAAAGVIGSFLAWYFARRYYKKQKREAAEQAELQKRLAEELKQQAAGQSEKLDGLLREVGKVVAYFDGLPTSTGAVRTNFDAGMAAMGSSKWDEAIAHFREAIKEGKGTQLVALFNLIGLCHYTPGRWQQALTSYEESRRLAQEFGDTRGRAAALGNIGLIYRAKGEPDQALKYLEEALAIDREIGYKQGVASDLGNIGLVLVDMNRHEQAVPKLVEALAMFLAIGVADGPSQVLKGLIRCEDRLGRQRMEGLFKEAGMNDESIANLLNTIDQMRQKMGGAKQ